MCVSGKYQAGEGGTGCVACPAGTYTMEPAQRVCRPCAPGVCVGEGVCVCVYVCLRESE